MDENLKKISVLINTESKFMEYLISNNDEKGLIEFCLQENFKLTDKQDESMYKFFLQESFDSYNEESLLSESSNYKIENFDSLRVKIQSAISNSKNLANYYGDKFPEKKKELQRIVYNFEKLESDLSKNAKPEGFGLILHLLWRGVKTAFILVSIILGGFGMAAVAGFLVGSGSIFTGLLAIGVAVLMVFGGIYISFWTIILSIGARAIKMNDDGTLSDSKKKQITKELNDNLEKLKQVTYELKEKQLKERE